MPAEENHKEILGVVFKQFVEEESGNRVTVNNLGFLLTRVFDILDGRITLNPPKPEVPQK